MNSDEQIDSLSSPYSPESLSPSSRSLLECICKNVTGASLGKRSKNSTVHQWDAVAFENFVERMFPEERECFLKLLIEKDVKYKSTFKKISLEGVGEHTALKVFCSSAEAQKKHLDIFLKDYIQYSDNFGLKPERLIGYEEAIRSLLGAGDTSFQQNAEEVGIPLHSPQDHIAISNEIEKIKQELQFYPFFKDQIHVSNFKSDYSKALSKIDKLLVVSPSNVELLSLKIPILILLKQRDEALSIAQPLYDRNMDNVSVLNAYSAVLSSFNKYADALEISKKAREGERFAPSISFNIGIFYERLGKYEDAIKEYTYAKSLDTDYIKPYYRLSLCYARVNQLDKSEAAIIAARRLAPDNYLIIAQWLKIKHYQGDTNEVFQYIDSYIKTNSDDMNTKYLSALLVLKDGDTANAEAIISDLLGVAEFNLFESKGSQSTAYSLLGTVFGEAFNDNGSDSKLLNSAKVNHKEALELDSQNHTALEGLAEISYLSREYEKSKQYLEQVSQLYYEYTNFERYYWEPYVELSFIAKERGTDCMQPLLWCSEKYDDCIQIKIYLAREYISLENPIDAKVHIDKALDILDGIIDDPNISLLDAQECYALGKLIAWFENIWSQQGMYLQKALDIFEKLSSDIIKNNNFPLWVDSVCGRAEALYLQGKCNEDISALNNAISVYEDLLKECPKYKYQELWTDVQEKVGRIHLELD